MIRLTKILENTIANDHPIRNTKRLEQIPSCVTRSQGPTVNMINWSKGLFKIFKFTLPTHFLFLQSALLWTRWWHGRCNRKLIRAIKYCRF